MTVQVVILAAGLGTRLALPHPKPLTRLVDGRSIMQQQVDNLEMAFGTDMRLSIVVGYKCNLVMEHTPRASFVHNRDFRQTNTSKSLLKALKTTAKGGVIWLNGDVVFDPTILELMKSYIDAGSSVLSVNKARVSNEEMKYTLTSSGHIGRLSKEIPPRDALGEAVGINFVAENDKESLIRRLTEVAMQDYFEQAIEQSIIRDRVNYSALDIGAHLAIEIDSPEDLNRANSAIAMKRRVV